MTRRSSRVRIFRNAPGMALVHHGNGGNEGEGAMLGDALDFLTECGVRAAAVHPVEPKVSVVAARNDRE